MTTTTWNISKPGEVVLSGTMMSIRYQPQTDDTDADFACYQWDRFIGRRATLDSAKFCCENRFNELQEMGIEEGGAS